MPVFQEIPLEECFIDKEPYYVPVGNEVEVFMAAYKPAAGNHKGPTGCGKTVLWNTWHTG